MDKIYLLEGKAKQADVALFVSERPVVMTEKLSQQMQEIRAKNEKLAELRAPAWRFDSEEIGRFIVYAGLPSLFLFAASLAGGPFSQRSWTDKALRACGLLAFPSIILFSAKVWSDNRAKRKQSEPKIAKLGMELNVIVPKVKGELLKKFREIRDLIKPVSDEDRQEVVTKREQLIKAQKTVRTHVYPLFSDQAFKSEVNQIFSMPTHSKMARK